MMTKKLPKIIGLTSSTIAFLTFAASAFAQSATSGASGTSGALPGAGSTELTYILFVGGVILFVIGMLKLVGSYRD